MLTVDRHEIEKIHASLIQEFVESGDPISPSGIRSEHLLESALSRQFTGFQGALKYPEPRENAAALMYGLCLNHSFHNGNKRTALVSGLVHLQKNGYFPKDVRYNDFYEVICALAAKNITTNESVIRKAKLRSSIVEKVEPAERDVFLLAEWLKKNTRALDVKERTITYRKLRPILEAHGCEFSQPQGNFIKLHRKIIEPRFFKNKVTLLTITLSYPGPNFELTKRQLKQIREELKLTEDDGLDSKLFYDLETAIDLTICKYWGLLKRLART